MVTLERLNQLGFPCYNCKYYDPNVDVDDNEFEDYYKDNLCICAGDYAFPCQYKTYAKRQSLRVAGADLSKPFRCKSDSDEFDFGA